MRVLTDTSVIVDIDRNNAETVDLFKKLAAKTGTDLVISTVTVSEILTGCYLRKDSKAAALKAKEVLGQFLWIDLDGAVAEKTAQLLAYLLTERKDIGYQDTAIAATFLISCSDYLLTSNKKDFLVFPQLSGKVFTPVEFASRI